MVAGMAKGVGAVWGPEAVPAEGLGALAGPRWMETWKGAAPDACEVARAALAAAAAVERNWRREVDMSCSLDGREDVDWGGIVRENGDCWPWESAGGDTLFQGAS
jgi:hypothetical protein